MRTKPTLMLLLCAIMLVSACSASHSQKKEDLPKNKTTTPAKKAPGIFGTITSYFDDDKDVYLYFYADSYPQSNEELPRIKKLAEAEKAGVVVVDVEDRAMLPMTQIYSIYYVPSVILLRKGQGIVETYHGKRKVERLDKSHKSILPEKYLEMITENTSAGKTTVLEFYADWCDPCLEQMPALENAEKQSDGRLSVIRMRVDEETKMITLYNIDAPPANIILDKNGIPRAKINKVSTPAYLLDTLEALGLL